jgi:hypothetical protein
VDANYIFRSPNIKASDSLLYCHAGCDKNQFFFMEGIFDNGGNDTNTNAVGQSLTNINTRMWDLSLSFEYRTTTIKTTFADMVKYLC